MRRALDEELRAQLYQQIGQLKVELDWLKKKLDSSLEYKRQLIEANHQHISVAAAVSVIRAE